MIASSRPRRPTVGGTATQLNLAAIALSSAQAERTYERVVMFEGPDLVGGSGAIVLAAAVPTALTLADAVGAAIRAGAAALVVREPVDLDAATRSELDDAGLALLGAPADTDWLRLASYLSEEPTSVPYGIDDASASDLFDLANSLAAVLDGPVTIENTAHRILAFSADQAAGDEARKQGVLGHQVPQDYTDLLVRGGVMRRIDASPTPVAIPSIAPGVLPRVAMRIRAGGESLGSIWAITTRDLTDLQMGALIEAAAVASITLFRQRASADAARRIRLSEILDLLDGGVRAKEAAERLGYGAVTTTVFAASYVSRDSTPSDEAASSQRLADALGLYLHQLHPLSVAATVGGTVYAILPHSDPAAADAFARQVATTFSERFRHGRAVAVGLSAPVTDITRLQLARGEADRALRVLVHTHHERPSRRVATSGEVQVESLLLRLSDELGSARAEVTGPLATLRAHDTAAGSAYVDTLAVWLDAFGDVASAAAALHLHTNTLRYRLRRIVEITGVDLEDPEERFGLMLQLRLFRDALGRSV